jgi:large subunit ribosomal protein L6
MSRIGKLPIALPQGVDVTVSDGNVVQVKGPKGQMAVPVDPDISVDVTDGTVTVVRPTEQQRHRAMHGLYRSLIANVVTGVTEGYKKQLEVIGVGYRAEVNNGVLELALGFSHPIYFLPPDGVSITAETVRGKNPIVTIEGIDKQLVGQVAAKIRGLRPPEPYKGKGVRYVGEYVRRKAGKTAAR